MTAGSTTSAAPSGATTTVDVVAQIVAVATQTPGRTSTRSRACACSPSVVASAVLRRTPA
ncbi:MAG: hypothetical protein ACTIAP_09700 [Cellulosimicrobium funkei]